MFAFEEEMR